MNPKYPKAKEVIRFIHKPNKEVIPMKTKREYSEELIKAHLEIARLNTLLGDTKADFDVVNELNNKMIAGMDKQDQRFRKLLEELCLHSKEGYTTEVWIRKHFAEFLPKSPNRDKENK